MSFALVTYESSDQIGIVRLNNPDKLNPLLAKVLVLLRARLNEALSAKNARSIILAGSGKTFAVDPPIQDDSREIELLQSVCKQIENSGAPVIAAMNGDVAGNACELALACHIRIASNNANWILPDSSFDSTLRRLAKEIGQQKATDLLQSASKITAVEAHRLGLVNRLAEPENLLYDAVSLASEIAQLAPLSIGACLRAVERGLEMSLAEGLDLETELFGALFTTQDMREGTSAFLEKRKPLFKGR